mmetsp:Transcript_15208/g.45142  ORF Transcript_15208/g.45142 Transcript_15208/m.45142 type:complete len:298 (-) Transcript_15208:1827-2720(-)
MVRRRAEGGQWERQQTGVRESGCDGSKGGRGPHAAPGLASGGHHASVRLGGIRLCLGVRLPACRGGVAGIRLEHSRGLVRAPHPSDELPVVVRDKVRLQGRRREVMGAPRPHGVWLSEGGRRALAAPGSMSTYMDDPLGSVGSGTTATSTLSGTRITPLTSGAAASIVGRMRQVCVPSVMDQTERKTRSRCWKNLERPESCRVVACSTCSKHGPQSLTHHGTPPPSDSTRTCPMTPSASPHCPSVWRTAAATIAGMAGTPSATARQSSRPPRCRQETCMFPCDDMTVQLSAAASSAS